MAYPISKIEGSMSELVPIHRESLAAATPWRRVLDVYLDTLDSPHTRRAYERHVAAALEALEVATLAEVTGEMLAAWRAHVTGSELALGSQAQSLAALRSFLKWAGLFGAHTLSKDMIGELLKTPGGSVPIRCSRSRRRRDSSPPPGTEKRCKGCPPTRATSSSRRPASRLRRAREAAAAPRAPAIDPALAE
jgi:Phage integrase, N-terminal SAM-like domain